VRDANSRLNWVFTLLSTAQQQKERLPGGLLPEPGRKARKAVEEGGFSQKSRGLYRKRREGLIFQAYPGSSFLPSIYMGDCGYSPYTSTKPAVPESRFGLMYLVFIKLSYVIAKCITFDINE
jgi:hypothetical protein